MYEKVNNINLFIYIMTRALQDLAFSEYLLLLILMVVTTAI